MHKSVIKVREYLLQKLDGSAGPDPPLSSFTVAPGKRYRFRLAYAGGGRACPITVSIANHVLSVISLDGNPIVPREATAFVMAAGQQLSVNRNLAAWRLGAWRLLFAK
jgi:Putative multicopper oxidases